MKRKKHIKTKFLISMLSLIVTSMLVINIFAGITLFNARKIATYNASEITSVSAEDGKNSLVNAAISSMQNQSANSGILISTQLAETTDTLISIANYIGYLYDHKDEFSKISFPHAKDIPAGTLGLMYILPPGAKDEDFRKEIELHGNLTSLFNSVMKTKKDTISSIYVTTVSGLNDAYDNQPESRKDFFEGYDGHSAAWYNEARDLGGLRISKTYQDSFGRGLMVSMAMPCYLQNGEFIATVGIDIFAANLNETIQSNSFGESGYAVLISDGGEIISAPNLTDENRANISDYFGSELSAITSEILQSQNGTKKVSINDKEMYLAYSNVELTNWIYMLVVPEGDIIAPAIATADRITNIGDKANESLTNSINTVIVTMILLIIVVILIAVIIGIKITDSIVKPILLLSTDIKKIGNGNFDYTSEVDTSDEIEDLSHAFENMTLELKDYIKNLSVVTAEKERIGAELNVATEIQASMLPCIFPPFPDIPEIDIFASMKPAKEVGGDFYDFFKIDNDHICVVMADVSGKGVPAALFMVIAKTLIKDNVLYEKSPAAVFTKVNNQLCENNDAGLFVTTFMGIFENSTGKFTYVNAGHNPPLLKRADGDFEYLRVRPGFVLAGMEGIKYKENELFLSKDDILFLYTDGVTEALDEAGEFYGDPYLQETLNTFKKSDNLSSEALVDHVRASISDFVGTAQQADDITMLAFIKK